MSSTSEAIGKQLHFVLRGSSEQLRGEDLVRIIELAHKSEAIVHLSYSSWQVLIGVPERNSPNLEAELLSMGYVCTHPFGTTSNISTFVLEKGHDKAAL